MTDTDIEQINSNAVFLHLVYRRVCSSTKAYLLPIDVMHIHTVGMRPYLTQIRVLGRFYCLRTTCVSDCHVLEPNVTGLYHTTDCLNLSCIVRWVFETHFYGLELLFSKQTVMSLEKNFTETCNKIDTL